MGRASVRIVVVTCDQYRDALPGLHGTLAHFWPDCPYPITVVSDSSGSPNSWCGTVSKICDQFSDDLILLLMEDFWLTHPVEPALIQRAIGLFQFENVGAVRLFPCPGAGETTGDEFFGLVERWEAYRISCQATIWRPEFLREICRAGEGSAAGFEIDGSNYAAEYLKPDVMAFRIGLYPWPIQYICSAITRGRWERSAQQLCEKLGIAVDWSQRAFCD